ncbi:hypothetical protein BDV34DRAFT_212276 [Aspergillus parasiticus]|uniref:Aminoglycoside phosphotransferase domain-containing protein n=1 Tax=Aspergillus parasiticus TaxID=5067 RepID=A0A5N6DND2_ASPPA|nr:hypothetical protein BDV34DRAFT_212276 [Aspergillus parasiticus]
MQDLFMSRLRERYVKFDPDGLHREVGRHIGLSHGQAGEIVKIGEGGFNRVLLLIIEAVTLRFLYSKGVPVPQLYGYSSSNTGTEYIIIEKAAGVGLEPRWLIWASANDINSPPIVLKSRRHSSTFRPNQLEAFTSINHIPPDPQVPLQDEASTDSKMFWKRASLDISRGPWADPCSYLMSIAQKEIEWVRQYGKPLKLDFPHNGSTPGEVSPEEYIHLLEKFLLLAPYLLPRDSDNPLNQLTLRHPDLNPNNTFVSPASGGISCIIEWQHTTVEPRLLVAGHPRAFENPDIEQSPDLKEPSHHSDYNTLPAQAKVEADELYRRRHLYYYRISNGHLNKPHLQALRDPISLPRQHLVDRWGALVRMIEYWPHLPDTRGIKCPVEFTDAELEGFAKQEQMWFYLSKLVNYWRDEIGINEDGWVSNDRYEDAVRKESQLKDSLVEAAEGGEEDIHLLNEGWMFRDREEID